MHYDNLWERWLALGGSGRYADGICLNFILICVQRVVLPRTGSVFDEIRGFPANVSHAVLKFIGDLIRTIVHDLPVLF